MVIDESFIDFADETEGSLLVQNILEENKHVYVIKSISKAYGVPGLRLGILASGNTEMITILKKRAAIWNINSPAEFFMQIMGKYGKEYDAALKKVKKERVRLEGKLGEIDGIRAIPSQANYIMAELTNGMNSKELTQKLLAKHNLLIKDLSEKTGGKQFVRLAIRNMNDNEKLIAALKEEMEIVTL